MTLYKKYSIFAPIFAILVVVSVDYYAGKDRTEKSILQSYKSLSMLWEVAKVAVEAKGFDALPVQMESIFQSLDIYMVDKTGHFVSNPRFWPTAADSNLRADTDAVGSGISGERATRIIKDYRGIDVISSFGKVIYGGEEFVLLVEIDVAEAEGPVLSPWYYSDEIGIIIIAFIGLYMTFTYKPRKLDSRTKDKIQALLEDDKPDIYPEFFKHCPLGAILLERDGQIKDANQKLADTFGYSIDDLKSMHINSLLPDKYRAGHMNLVSGFLEKYDPGMTAARQVTGKHKDGREIPIDLSIGILSTYDFTGTRTIVGAGLTAEKI